MKVTKTKQKSKNNIVHVNLYFKKNFQADFVLQRLMRIQDPDLDPHYNVCGSEIGRPEPTKKGPAPPR